MAVTRKTKKVRTTPLSAQDKVRAIVDSIWKDLSVKAAGAGSTGKAQSVKWALALIGMQQAAFDRMLKLLERVQKQADKTIKTRVETAAWMPAEGREIVAEWNRALTGGRAEFHKTLNKSYDLLRSYLERVQAEQQPVVAPMRKRRLAGAKANGAKAVVKTRGVAASRKTLK